MKRMCTFLPVVVSILFFIGLLTSASSYAQTKYTADFSTSPTFSYEGNQTYYKTRTTVSINGVNYLIHNAINADFTWTGSAVSYKPYSGVGLIIEREDKQPFAFYNIDLNYTSVNTDLASAPWLRVSYNNDNGAVAPEDDYNETSKNFSVSKPSGVTVKNVTLFFADLATLVFDNLTVGPATGGTTCTNPTVPTISATRTAICAGSNTTLSIQSGSLNDATNWQWYSGSCGGTPVGSGSAIQVSPSSTTTYYVRGEGNCVTAGPCASQQITVSAPFFVSLTNNGPLTCVKKSITLTTTGGPSGATYTYSSGAQASSASSATATGSAASPYSVTVSVPGGCSATAQTSVSSNTVAPSISINPVSQTICQGQTATFTASGASSYTWSTGVTTAITSASVTGSYSVTGTSTSNGCTGTATANLTVNPLPAAPGLVTQSGYPYPAGQTSLTISQNVGPISLMASGCSGGMIMANGSVASSFTVSTASTGTQTYTATCTQNGCTGPTGSFQLTVVPTTLSVLHRDQDYGSTQNNIIKPYLELANAGGGAIPYSDITVRYWFTSEGQAPPTNLAVYYAQLGAVNMTYVALSQPRQGASGYVEYSFPGGGSLGSGGNSGPIENGIQKTDGSNFDETDDYSYVANYQDYVPNGHITAYRNGTIVWGQEPTTVSSVTAVQAYTQAKDGTITSQIQTRVELRNTGNVALAIQDLRIRYYFTSDNNQTANVYVDYADIGADNIQARVIKLPAPVGQADSYVELRTVPTSMSLSAMSSLGAIDFRLVRSDNGLFDQSNDYSFMGNYGNVGLNNRVTVLLNNRLIFGTPPAGAPARAISQEASSVLAVRALGNPVVGSQAQVEISGAASQAVLLRLVDMQGRTIHEQRIEQASETEQVSLPLGSSRGTLLLKVNTDSQQQSLKLLRP